MLVYSCNKNDYIVEPELSYSKFSNSGKWVEVLRVDSVGHENPNGNFTIENALEFFDTTYEFTSRTIKLEDSINIIEDKFFLHHEGKFSSRHDTLNIYTSDKYHLNSLKTDLADSTLWVAGIMFCTLDGPGPTYPCIGVMSDTYIPFYMSSFIWDKFQSKKTATFTKQ